MALVVFTCDTCKRNIQVPRNIKGLEIVQRCTITLGCRGKLFQTSLLQDYSQPSILNDIQGLTNWQPRKALFNFTQTLVSQTWDIQHNLDTYPVITVYVNNPTTDNPYNVEQKVPETIEIISSNEIKISFMRPYSGVAQLVARSTSPGLLQPTNIENVIPKPTPVQLTNNCNFILATLYNKFGTNLNLNLQLQFTTNAGISTTYFFTSTTNLDTSTSWSDVNTVVINGKIYLLRQFSGLTTDIATGQVSNGTIFRFQGFDTNLDGTDNYVIDNEDQISGSPPLLNTGDMLLLLSNSPFDVIDKNVTQFIDISLITSTKNIGTLYYNNLEFYANPSVIGSIYPPIRPVS